MSRLKPEICCSLKFEISNLRLLSWRWAAMLATLILTLAAATPAHAQGCAMCYNTAAAASPGAIHALRSGILVLLFPPLAMFVAIFTVALRRRRFDEQEGAATEDAWQ